MKSSSPYQQKADAVPGQVGAGIPALDDLADVQAVVLADGDQRLRQDEHRQLAGGELAGRGVEPRGVDGHEQVRVVPVDLRSLPVEQRVLDLVGVQAELVLQHQEVVAVRVAQVEPDRGRAVGQVVADPLDREALVDEPAFPVEPGARLAPGLRDLADRGLRPRRAGRGRGRCAPPRRRAAELAAERAVRGAGLR